MKKLAIALVEVVAITLMTVGTASNCSDKDSQKHNNPPYERCYEPNDKDGNDKCKK